MFTFLVVGMDYMRSFDDRFIEMFGMIIVAIGVFVSSILFYLAWLVNVKDVREMDKESIIYRNVNRIVDREIRNFKVKRLKVWSDRT
jgi:hypothetical protein